MKWFVSGIFAVVFSTIFVLAAVVHGNPATGGVQVGGMNTGCAKVLTGNVFVFTSWLSQKGWDPDRRRQVEDGFSQALDWLAENARAYGKRLKFMMSDRATAFRPIRDADDAQGSEAGSVFLDVLRGASGHDEASMMAFAREHGCENWVYVIFADQIGRSYARVITGGQGDWLEVAVNFTMDRYPNTGRVYDEHEAVYAHEFLHAFGAIDMYAVGQFTEQQAAYAKRLWPNEIMHTSWKPFDQTAIGPMTAYLVGWHTAWDPAWNALIPNDRRRGNGTGGPVYTVYNEPFQYSVSDTASPLLPPWTAPLDSMLTLCEKLQYVFTSFSVPPPHSGTHRAASYYPERFRARPEPEYAHMCCGQRFFEE